MSICLDIKAKRNLSKNVILSSKYMQDQETDIFGIFLDIYVFKLIFQEGIPENQAFVSEQTKAIFFDQSDQKVQMKKVEKSELPQLSSIEFEIYSLQRNLPKVIQAGKIKDILYSANDYINRKQQFFIQYVDNDTSYKLILQTLLPDSISGGLITQMTKIKLKKNVNQKFILYDSQNIENNTEELNLQGKNLKSQQKIKVIQKKIGGLNHILERIEKMIFGSRGLSKFLIQKFDIQHVKGLLLYGPPGTGKTAIARQIASIYDQVTIINGPQVMSKFIGVSEETVRKPFEAAKKDQQQKGINSPIHVIIFDQFDAICKVRSGAGTTSSNVYDSMVNQLLSSMDGVYKLNNILVIAMTNRKQLIDPAILRPGRVQIHAEIGLPSKAGRQQIFKIYTSKYIQDKVLGADVVIEDFAEATENYTWSEIKAFVNKAFSFALSQWKNYQNFSNNIGKKYFIQKKHFDLALQELIPQFGSDSAMINKKIPHIFYPLENIYPKACQKLEIFADKVEKAQEGKFLILLTGQKGTGKRAIACKLAKRLKFPFTKMINVDKVIGLNQTGKVQKMLQIFYDSMKVDHSCILFEQIIDLVQYIPLGNHYSKVILQCFSQILKKSPQNNKKLVIIATQSQKELLKQLGVYKSFQAKVQIPLLNKKSIEYILRKNQFSLSQARAISVEMQTSSLSDIISALQLTKYKRDQFLSKWKKICNQHQEENQEQECASMQNENSSQENEMIVQEKTISN